MGSGFHVALLVDRRPLRTAERNGMTYALAAPGRAFEVAVSHSNNATYMARLEVDGIDAEPVRAVCRVVWRDMRRVCKARVLCGRCGGGGCGAPVSCP